MLLLTLVNIIVVLPSQFFWLRFLVRSGLTCLFCLLFSVPLQYTPCVFWC